MQKDFSILVEVRNSIMRPLTVSLIGAAALLAGILIVREIRAADEAPGSREIRAGEREPSALSLDRIRSLGY
jgi:hypothetical protein